MSIINENFDVFCTVEYYKDQVGIKNDLKNDQILGAIMAGNKQIHTDIFPYIDTPIGASSIYFSRCRDAAYYYARAYFLNNIDFFDKAKTFTSQYKEAIDKLWLEFKATRTDRTKNVLIAADPKEKKIPLPTQNDIYVFDEFA